MEYCYGSLVFEAARVTMELDFCVLGKILFLVCC